MLLGSCYCKETVEEWFDHAWHDWAVGGGGPPDLA